MPRDPNEIGALWSKTSSRGEYFTGMINGEPVVVFRNDRKTDGSKQPDWRVLKAKPRDQAPKPVAAGAHQEPEPDDDIPF